MMVSKSVQIEGDRFDKQLAVEKLTRAINNGRTTIHEEIQRIVNPGRSSFIAVSNFKEVARLQEGQSFGELALLQNTGRAATIVCSKQTSFATLSKKDYVHTIGYEEKRSLKENVNKLRKFRIFSDRNLRDNTLEKIYRYMELKKYRHGNKVYQEGVSETDGVYFIKDGDFEITQLGPTGQNCNGSSCASFKKQPSLKVAKRALSRNDTGTSNAAS